MPERLRKMSNQDPGRGSKGRAGGRSYFTELLLSTVNSMESAAKVRESLAFAYWATVAGPQAAEATEVEAVRDGILFVRTKSSVWSHELTLHKEQLISGLNKLLGGRIIKEIVYKARGVKTKPPPTPEVDAPPTAELDAVLLEPAELAELQQNLVNLKSIASGRIRDVMAARMTRDLKLRHWRIERGWKICGRCVALHKTRYRLCPICRLCK